MTTALPKMKDMWKTLKEYFGDGYAPGSAPLSSNVHFCDMKRTRTTADTVRYGAEIEEEALALFSTLGETTAPTCSCNDMAMLIEHIDSFLETAPNHFPSDYSIHTEKCDTSLDSVSLYAVRDTLSWWVHWGGQLLPGHYWKQMYTAISTVLDDIQVPPQDLFDGTYRFLGHTWSDCRAGLLGEGLSAELVEFAEMCLMREAICQYVEKVDPPLRRLMLGRTTLMTQFHVLTGNILGCGALYLACKEPVGDARTHLALEAAAFSQCLALDMAKETLGVLKGERTETVAGNRAHLKRELRWLYGRCVDWLDAHAATHAVLRRYAACSLVYVPMMDRYLERARANTRFPIPEAMARHLEPFIKREPVVPFVQKEPVVPEPEPLMHVSAHVNGTEPVSLALNAEARS